MCKPTMPRNITIENAKQISKSQLHNMPVGLFECLEEDMNNSIAEHAKNPQVSEARTLLVSAGR